MTQYNVTTTSKQDELIAASGIDVQAVLEGKIEELVNLGRKSRHESIASAYEKADAQVKEQIDSIVEAVELQNADVEEGEVINP